MVNDSISNLINSLKVASIAKKDSITVPSSKKIVSILDTLKKFDFIESYEVSGDKKKTVKIELKYIDGLPKINDAKRISKFSKRIYKKTKEFRPIKSGYGISVVTTEKGVMSGVEAKKSKVGGEVLFEIW
ncbi:MAG TPA: 30S ribosomal protein S8 [Candidatus Paceibacterota bacterium]|nr:30S ribosomal protein S8 [Candidatus Paceibacterota bacterium]